MVILKWGLLLISRRGFQCLLTSPEASLISCKGFPCLPTGPSLESPIPLGSSFLFCSHRGYGKHVKGALWGKGKGWGGNSCQARERQESHKKGTCLRKKKGYLALVHSPSQIFVTVADLWLCHLNGRRLDRKSGHSPAGPLRSKLVHLQ